jgi:hypothetical protein
VDKNVLIRAPQSLYNFATSYRGEEIVSGEHVYVESETHWFPCQKKALELKLRHPLGEAGVES